MKKWILFILVSFCVCPAFAQKGLGRVINGGAKKIINPSAVARSAFRASPQFPLLGQKVQIRNFPDNSPVIIYTSPESRVSARALLPDELRKLLLVSNKLHAPEHFQENKRALYRGMVFNQLDDLKNLLQNGLEVKRSHYPGEIWTTPDPGVALGYALPSSWDYAPDKFPTGLPVVVRILHTPYLFAQNQPDIFWQNRVFFRDIPARYISEADVLLEVNNKLGWYKATLEKEELVLRPVTRDNAPTDLSNGAQSPARNTFFAEPDETRVSAPGAEFRVLPDEELRQAISNDDEMKLFVPESFVQEDHMLYRGLRLKNTAELRNILLNGMEINKAHHEKIYTTPNVSIALGYMFPHQMSRLLETAEDEMLPVLVKIPVTERLMQKNLPQKAREEFGGQRVFDSDIAADEIAQVAVYIEKDGVRGWYKVIWENEQLAFIPVASKTISGWLAE